MKRLFFGMLAVGAVLISSLGIPLYLGVWLPGVLFKPTHILAERHLPGGYSLQVVKYWNSVDFFTTELRHTRPNCLVEVHLLDADDSKSWSAAMDIN